MSNQVFPTLPGLTWNVVRALEFHTRVQKAVSGREVRLAFMSSPMYTFKLSYSVLRQDTAYNEMKTLAGFFLARLGSFDSFLYLDPTDNTATNAAFGVGDGSTTQFQLIRPYGAPGNVLNEQVQNPLPPLTIKVGGSTVTGWTQSNGLVTFNTAPANGAALTWSGQFYYRVRFKEDVSEFNQFLANMFELKKLELYGSLANKV